MKHRDIMSEVVRYGREVLGMSDREMAAELGCSHSRIFQFRSCGRTAAGVCGCGRRINKAKSEKCSVCRRAPRIALCACGTRLQRRRVAAGHTKCSACFWMEERSRLYRESPDYKALHLQRCKASKSKRGS